VNPYFVLPLASGLACLVFGILIAARDPSATSNRCIALLLLGACWWGITEALWTLSPEPERALAFVRLSALGWIAVAPVSLQLFLAEMRRPPRGLRRALPAAYGAAALALAVEWTTPFMHPAVVPVPWGWGYRVGAAYPVWLVFSITVASAGVFAALRELRASPSPAESRQRPWLATAVAIPLFVGSTTDGLLPWFEVQSPRLGVVSFALLGALITATMHRFGYTLLAPGSLASRVLDAMPEGVALIAPDGRIRQANPGLARLLGQPVAALLERPVSDFLPGLPPGPGEPLREDEREIASESGQRIPVTVSASPLRDKQGDELGLVLVVRDLREVVSLRTRLLTSARLAAVGELAAGIAHEINNPLAYIGSNLRALREQWFALGEALRAAAPKETLEDLFEEGLEMVDDSLEGVERTAAIVRDVRAFSHGGQGTREALDVNELVGRALRLAEPQFRARARVVREYGRVPSVTGVRRELEQVVLNLLVNAVQALEGPGTVTVRTTSRDDEVVIQVADDGRGIPPDHVERIFDPFFTTKPVGVGTGLGLSISHEIVRRHGGRIDVSSEPGRGSEFRVRLPIPSEE
jgi:signal transduction histidine kinase